MSKYKFYELYFLSQSVELDSIRTVIKARNDIKAICQADKIEIHNFKLDHISEIKNKNQQSS
jgi:hypothetical protein